MPLKVIVQHVQDGVDSTAWISAAAAVVQAVGAIVAIIYSGKLARDAAAREKAAEEANARRIKEANAAAVEQRRLDAEAAELRRLEDERARHNQPIVESLDAAQHALADIKASLNKHRAQLEHGQVRQEVAGLPQRFAFDKIRSLSSIPGDAEVAATLQYLGELFEPFTQGIFQSSRDWVQVLEPRISTIEATMTKVEQLLWHNR